MGSHTDTYTDQFYTVNLQPLIAPSPTQRLRSTGLFGGAVVRHRLLIALKFCAAAACDQQKVPTNGGELPRNVQFVKFIMGLRSS